MSSLFTTEENSNLQKPRRKSLLVIPLLLIIGTISLFYFTGWNKLYSATKVDVIRARMSHVDNRIQEGKTLFQAAGWIHADPYATHATALVSGVITKVHVIDGQKVSKGQLLAELNNENFELALREAQAKLEELKLNAQQQTIKIDIFKSRITENISLKETALAAVKTAQHKAETLQKSGFGIAKFDKEQAGFELQEKVIKAKEFDQKIAVLNAQIDLQKNVIKIAKSKIKTQEVNVDKINLHLERCKIYAPTAGIIQKLYARVGRKQELRSDNELSTTIAKIFDPKHILVMVDVPLNDLQKVKLKQKTKIHLDAIDEVLEGVVIATHGQADYQKNTLQVHIRILGGHPDARPEMLAQVEFLADKPATQEIVKKSGIFVDKRCLQNGNKLYVVSLKNQLVIKAVELGEEKDGWIEVLSEIHAGESIVLNPSSSLKDGQNVTIGDLHE